MASFFSHKARHTSTPKRHSSRRVARKAPKELSARAKSTIRKIVATIAGFGSGAALTYAGLFLANQMKVNKCLEAQYRKEWRQLNCNKVIKNMITNSSTKKKMKRHRKHLNYLNWHAYPNIFRRAAAADQMGIMNTSLPPPLQ